MKTIKLTSDELKILRKVKKELLNDSHATFKSQSRNNDRLQKVADKYGVSTQVIYDSIN